MLRLAVLVSGGGTNLQAILDAIDEGTITNAEVSVVISNNAGAYALERAKKKEIDAVCLSPKTFASREAFNEALLAKLQSYNVDLVVLAGCLVVIPQSIVDAYPNKIINIHPSLIPSFCGTGYYGLKVHEGVLLPRRQSDGSDGSFCGRRNRHRPDYSAEGSRSARGRYTEGTAAARHGRGRVGHHAACD